MRGNKERTSHQCFRQISGSSIQKNQGIKYWFKEHSKETIKGRWAWEAKGGKIFKQAIKRENTREESSVSLKLLVKFIKNRGIIVGPIASACGAT